MEGFADVGYELLEFRGKGTFFNRKDEFAETIIHVCENFRANLVVEDTIEQATRELLVDEFGGEV